jgi:hypothetical protein
MGLKFRVGNDRERRNHVSRQHYIDGAKSGRSAEMSRAFHADATIFGYEGDSLFAGPIQRLFDWHDQNGPAADLKATIVNIDIAGTIATVRLELDNWTGTNYTDLFTLLKVDGHWKIVNKVFHIHRSPPCQAIRATKSTGRTTN